MHPFSPNRNSFNFLIFNLFLLITLLYCVQISHGASLDLTWNPNTEDDLAGYKVYYGASSGSYGAPIDVGNVTGYELSGLTAGETYYVAITAYDTSDNESEKSDEVSGEAPLPPDTQDPAITITSPTSASTYSTSSGTINVGGTASDNVGVTSITWSNDRGGSGTASGTTSWSVASITLQEGDNLLTVTAQDAAGNSASDTLAVTYTPPDTQNPTITITSPTSSSSYSTSNWTITISGNASDNRGVTSVSWSNNRGGVGVATGTTSWTALNISLAYGDNVITVVARDEAGNTGSDTVAINYALNPGSYTHEFGNAEDSDHYDTIQDTFINTSHELNYNSIQLNTYTWPTNTIANAIIMKWDLSALPGDAYIQSATLSLYLTESGGDNTYSLSAHKIIHHDPEITECDGYTYDGINPWTDSGLTPPLAQADIQPAANTQDIDSNPGYKSWNITHIVRDWMSTPDENYGVLINSDPVATADSYRYFASTENDISSRRPKLIVTFFAGDDTEDPVITITDPATATLETAENTIDLNGTASDNVEVTEVTWSNDRGGSGTASGTTSWTITSIPLRCGRDNTITVTAEDAAGNSDTDTLTIDVRPCKPGGLSAH